MLDALAEGGFAVHAPLLTGHGTHPGQLQDVTFDEMVADMRARARRGAGARTSTSSSRASRSGASWRSSSRRERPDGLLGLVLLGNALTLSPPSRAALGFIDRHGWKLPDWYLLKLWSADMRDREPERSASRRYDRDPLRAALEVYRAAHACRARRLGRDRRARRSSSTARAIACVPGRRIVARSVASALGCRARRRARVSTRRAPPCVAADHANLERGRPSAVPSFVGTLARTARRQLSRRSSRSRRASLGVVEVRDLERASRSRGVRRRSARCGRAARWSPAPCRG